MELTKEKALELHRQMWTDMQKTLGDNPNALDRIAFKEDWCDKHFPCEHITHSCFLCEYTCQFSRFGVELCSMCPVVWPCEQSCVMEDYFCEGKDGGNTEDGYRFIPISKILSLPEREGA